MFTDWMGTEFTQGVAFGQFIQLEMLFSYDEVSLSAIREHWTVGPESGYRANICRPSYTYFFKFLSAQENKPLLKVQQILHRRSKVMDGTLVPRYCKILGSPAENESKSHAR